MADSSFYNAFPTEQQLWQGIREGDEQAFATVFDTYHKTLYNYGRKLSSDTAVVEDAIQDVFLDIWRLRANLAPAVGSIKFYLYRSLRRKIHRTAAHQLDIEDLESIPETDALASVITGESTLLSAESEHVFTHRIQQLLANLPKRQVEALTLHYFDDFTVEEIAQLMEINEKSVRNLLYKTLALLRQNRHWLLLSLFALVCWLAF